VTSDLAAEYARHRDAMYRVAAEVLRGTGVDPADAVQNAMLSLLKRHPADVQNWEAFFIKVVKRKALDLVRSAHVRHEGAPLEDHEERPDGHDNFADDVVEDLDRIRRADLARQCMAVLDQRHKKAVWDSVVLNRSRDEIAAELGVTPPRVSQMKAEGLKRIKQEMERREAT